MQQQIERKKKKNQPQRSGHVSRERKSVAGELAHIAGIERVPSRDPVHHLIEHSRSMFDMLGRVNAEKMMGDDRSSFDAVNKELNATGTSDKSEKPDKPGFLSSLFGGQGAETEGQSTEPGGDFYKRGVNALLDSLKKTEYAEILKRELSALLLPGGTDITERDLEMAALKELKF